MKFFIKKITLSVLLLKLTFNVNAQTSVFGNNSGIGNEFLGWNAGNPKSLDIVNGHLPIFDMNFYTNAGAGPIFVNMRQRILGNYSATGGLIGIGDLGTSVLTTFAPFSLLHFYRTGNTDVYEQFSNDNTGFGVAPASDHQGFQIGIGYDNDAIHYDLDGYTPPASIAELKQWHDAPIDFYSADNYNTQTGYTLPIRMRICYGNGSSHVPKSYLNPINMAHAVTKVIISHDGQVPGGTMKFFPMEQGVAMLNLGENSTRLPIQSRPYVFGARNWMDVGTFHSFDTDNMYVGLKDNGYNNKDAMINWGDDPSASETVNHLLFNFTSAAGGLFAGGLEGLEIARMVSLDATFGRMGIGGDPNITIPNTNLYHGGGVEPGNTLEVNSPDKNETITTGGNSGLRFSDLNTSSRTTANPGSGILAVNSDGDVIYVEDIGNYCNNPFQRPITGNYEIPLTGVAGSYDYYFTGQKDGSTDVLIGNACSNSTPWAKLQSYQPTTQTSSPVGESDAGRFTNSTHNKHAIGGVGISETSDQNNYGLKGYAGLNIGTSNYGVFGTTVNFPMIMANVNVGVYGYSPANGHSGATIRHAVVGDLGVAACTSFPCPTGPDYAGYFNGDVISTTNIFQTSDANLKDNIQDLTDPMSIVSQLSPKTYTFKQADNISMQLPNGTHYGLLAQDVESILPELVKSSIHPARYDSAGVEVYPEIDFKALNYIELIPLLVGAIKEQQQDMEAMQAEIALLNGGGNRHGNPGSSDDENSEESPDKGIDVQLMNAKAIILNQNVPNPFAEQTSISYFIPDNISKAQIFFYDNKGTILKIVDINEKGAGQLNVFASDLSSGNYTYSLIADGKLIETKKMTKQ